MLTRRALLIAGATLPVVAHAQTAYPTRPIRLIVPYTPGGLVDNFARPFAQKMSEQLGQQLFIDNRGGASGMVGGSAVAKAEPDGYSLLCTSGSNYLTPLVVKNAPYDPVKDFTPIIVAVKAPVVVVVHNSLSATNIKELIDIARKTPEGLNYVTAGVGTQQHLTGEMIARSANIRLTHVAYKGGNPAVNDLVAGHVKVGVLGLSTVTPLVEAGHLRILGVVESHRSTNYPNLPTLGESGLPGFASPDTYLVILGPAGMPSALVQRLNSEAARAIGSAEVRDAIKAAGYEAYEHKNAQASTEFVEATYAFYKKVTSEVKLMDD